jgi:hypothetical protein
MIERSSGSVMNEIVFATQGCIDYASKATRLDLQGFEGAQAP